MKRFQLIRRSTSFLLAVTLLFAQPIGTFAQEQTNSESSQSVNSSLESNTSTGNTSLGNTSTSNTSTDTSNNSKQTTETKKETEITTESSESNSQKATEAKESAETSDSTNEADASSSITDEEKNAKKETEKTEETDADKEVIKEKEKSSKEADSNDDEYEYKSNEDGTHVKIHKETKEEITEDCEFDENGICKHCGYEKDAEKLEEDKFFEVQVGEYTIRASVPAGAFDEEVEFKADRIELSSEEKKLADEATISENIKGYIAFDLRFVSVETQEEIEPNKEYPVGISMDAENINTDEVIHIIDEEKAEVIDLDVSASTIEFETDTFSTFAFPERNQRSLYDNTAYGSASVNAISIIDRGIYPKNNQFVLEIKKSGMQSKYFPASNETCIFGAQGTLNLDSKFEFDFVAPENYYIKSINLYSGWNLKNSVSYNDMPTRVKFSAELCRALWGKNEIIIDFQPIPTMLTSEQTTVNGAKFVKFEDCNRAFGESFEFNYGKSDKEWNTNHYGMVYQGLANPELSNISADNPDYTQGIFKLDANNGKPVFPSYDSYRNYPYISGYYNDAGVVFNKDTDGYWTVDSYKYRYAFDQKCNRLIPVDGNQFRPFGYKNHFGMILPISFTVDKSGKTNGKDTIFKFFGDDDVFVYVDGKLVLDIGGIHNAVKGQINFRTGEVLLQGEYDCEGGRALTSSKDDSVYVNKNLGVKNLYEIIDEDGVAELSEEPHTLTVVYFERGANESNCKMSFNFQKNETTTVGYKNFKIDKDGNGLAGAQFTLYTNPECTEVAQLGGGSSAISVTDNEGSFSFENISVGVIPDGQDSVSKDYYMKETKAPNKYVTPTDAVWKLSLTVFKNGTTTRSLTPYDANHYAEALSKMESGNVIAIVNELFNQPKNLVVRKEVISADQYNNNDAEYIFRLCDQMNNKNLAGYPYTVNGNKLVTGTEGEFRLKAGEEAVFENLTSEQYCVAEVGVESNKYSLFNYVTSISVDNQVIIENDTRDIRDVQVVYTAGPTVEKKVVFNNKLDKFYDWQLKKTTQTGNPLAGAYFELKPQTGKSYYGVSGEDGVVKWYDSQRSRQRAKDDNLEVQPGEYVLIETKAPEGYAKSEDQWQIKVDEHNCMLTNAKENLTQEMIEENGVHHMIHTLTFTNAVLYTLPETGGRGLYINIIGGVLLMIGAALLLYKTKRTI